MKIKLMTSLVASALLLLGGCSVEDAVKDLLGTNAIYVVNGTGGGITVSVTGENDKYLAAHNKVAQAYYLIDQKSTTVSYNGDHAHKFSSGGPYLYAATTCNQDGYLTDSTNSNRVHVVNLTSETFSDNVYVIDADGVQYTITDNATACAVTKSSQADSIKIGNGMQVKIGNGDWETINNIPSEIEAIANKVKVDVIVYSTTEGTVVPMAGYDIIK